MAKKKKVQELLNDIDYFTTYEKLKNLALHVFEWDGLPEGMHPEDIEGALFYYGRALFFRDSNIGLLCLRASPGSTGVNVYGRHTRYRASGHNYSEEYELGENAVLIKNNMLMSPTDNYVMMFTYRLVEIQRTVDINVKAQKTPVLITCDEKDLLTFKNIYNQFDGNSPVIYADKSINLNSLEVHNTDAPYVADKLTDLKHDLMNELLSFFGINNANTDKRERLNTDEVNANNEYIDHNAELMLYTRQRAVDEINKNFGLNISVTRKEFSENEPVHDDVTPDNNE